eukprot:TRINITY_DN8374_c0_g1_i4.p1 TRINITY_DN8374_c0_g1~~TRINITY_DN8374_c0_g1_i4.p1  ORF type:complete len:505 (+),score=127.32 TRINITY_DN8374_c0_g1_i4:44-1516(+)
MLALAVLSCLAGAALPLGYQPHIVFFLADDLGHYNLGYLGNTEVDTPTIDSLAREGVVLERHYVYQFCSPTRSSFLSGRLPIHVNTLNGDITTPGGVDIRMKLVSDKLKAAGYLCHQVGKWHAGGSCTANLPVNRGFNTSLGYLDGEEDHYNQTCNGYIDMWNSNQPAYGYNGSSCPADEPYCESPKYNAYQYVTRSVEIISEHDPNTPLFLYHAFQETHVPYEVPLRFQNASVDYELRRVYGGMVNALESGVKNITDALKARGMWDRTLIVFSSDNGGRTDGDFGGNNYPLRGQKFTDFEGGVRVAAFVSGGALPGSKRGTTESGLIHICDWYATFSSIAGVDPSDKADGVPDIDSMDMTPTLFGSAASPRVNMVLSAQAIIDWPYKLVLGKQEGKGFWTGPVSPNATSTRTDSDPGCPSTCLFNINDDPNEHQDIKAANSAKHAELYKMLNETLATAFQTDSTPGYGNCIPFSQYLEEHRNFGGPRCT